MFSIRELFDVLMMTGAVGYIAMQFFRPSDPTKIGFDWDRFKFACLVTAPAIVLHELGHKFVATGFGLDATFHAAYGWLAFGLFLRIIGSGFLFFVPAYVTFPAATTPLAMSLIAFAGPAVNLILYLIASVILKDKKPRTSKTILFWSVTKRINGFLFLFNMIPLGFFDGAKVLSGLLNSFI